MEGISDEQRMEYATSFAALALYDGGAEITSEQITTLLDATNNEVEGFYPIIFAKYLASAENMSTIIASPGAGGGGGGDGGGGGGEGGDEAVEEKEEEKEEEEEIDMGGGMDMFGGDEEGGGGGDY